MDKELERIRKKINKNEAEQFELLRQIRKIEAVAKHPRTLAVLKDDLGNLKREHRGLDGMMTARIIFRAEESLRILVQPGDS